MGVLLAKIRQGYGEMEVFCPHCDDNACNYLSANDYGLHECRNCGEAFKIAKQYERSQPDLAEKYDDLYWKCRRLEERIQKLETELGIK